MIDVLGAATAVHDAARLHAVAATGLGAAPHPWFDHVVGQARRVLGVPIVLLVLVERSRQIVPGSVGLPEPWQQRREIPLTHSICQYVVGARAPLAIADTSRDPVLHTSDAIRDLGVAAYAGAPVYGRGGHVLGALCAIDARPRAWTTGELAGLHRIADRCARKLRALSVAAPATPAGADGSRDPGTMPRRFEAGLASRFRPVGPVRRLALPAAQAAGPVLWTPRELPADLTLDRRPPLRNAAAEVVLAGRWSGEPVAVLIRTVEDPPAVERFRHRIAVARAFRRTPPLVPADEYRWHDDRVLVVSRAIGEPLQRDRDDAPPPGVWAEVMRTAALLSSWLPSPADARAWSVDYEAWIARHERRGRLTALDARQLRAALRHCGDDRTFAHGNLTPQDVVRLPSDRLALTDFADAGVYLAGFDLASLALATPDTQVRFDMTGRVRDADIVEPFAVNLLLRVADESDRPPAVITSQGLARRHAALVGARRHARTLLGHLSAH
ncbi:GAF domain-containing protein [Dactylosporangium darangshiense]|uniref:GAF domain-containing protein n=1 Tax=Dactylosporangium darangshiense TaxID=579108 RepID=A0ABP8D914_9ACTN